MRFLLLFIAFIGYSSISYAETASSSIDSLESEFIFSAGYSRSTKIKTEFDQIYNFLNDYDLQAVSLKAAVTFNLREDLCVY
jgi:hypothetical protein